MKISWITPLIPKDVDGLRELVEAINNQTERVGEFILVSSGCSKTELETLNGFLRQLDAPFQHVARKRLHSIGSNKNAGVRVAKHSWVSFIDADDIPHRKRNELLIEAVRRNGESDHGVILHSLVKIPRDQEIEPTSVDNYFLDFPESPPRLFDELSESTKKKINQIASKKGFRKVYSILEFEGASGVSIHHAHITVPLHVLKNNPFPLRGIRRDEDVVLLNRLFMKGVPLRLLAAPLVLYREGWINSPVFDDGRDLTPFQFRFFLNRVTTRLTRRVKKRLRRLNRLVRAVPEKLVGLFRQG